MSVGDLDGDGKIDYVFNDGRRLIVALKHDGGLLWRHDNPNDPGVAEQYHNFTISVYDINADSKAEVICFEEINTKNCLVVLDGKTGIVKSSAILPFPAPRDYPDNNFYMQQHIAIANLRGLAVPQDILAIHASLEEVAAYEYHDDTLTFKWDWKTDTDGYSSGHYAYPYDMDDDGRDEVLAGIDILDENGQRLWQMPLPPFSPSHPDWGKDHPDNIVCADIDPDHPGKEIMAVGITGMWQFGIDGQVLWYRPTKLIDSVNGWFDDEMQELMAGRFRKDVPGLQMLVFSRESADWQNVVLIDSKGNPLKWDNQDQGPRRWITSNMDWDGDRTYDEIYSRTGIFDGYLQSISSTMEWYWLQTYGVDEFPPVVCDVQGDQREEILWYDDDELIIVMNAEPLYVDSLPSPWGAPAYRMRMANLNHCNAMYLDWANLKQDVMPTEKSIEQTPFQLNQINTIDTSLVATIRVGKILIEPNRRRLPIYLNTSKPISQIPDSLILTDRNRFIRSIPLNGSAPGQLFFGVIDLADSIPDGPAFFQLGNPLIGVDGLQGVDILTGDSIYIDQSPPTEPLQIRIISTGN